jgi:hypothetical protein
MEKYSRNDVKYATPSLLRGRRRLEVDVEGVGIAGLYIQSSKRAGVLTCEEAARNRQVDSSGWQLYVCERMTETDRGCLVNSGQQTNPPAALDVLYLSSGGCAMKGQLGLATGSKMALFGIPGADQLDKDLYRIQYGSSNRRQYDLFKGRSSQLIRRSRLKMKSVFGSDQVVSDQD